VIDLFEAAMRGDVPRSLSALRAQYDAGADPAVVLSDLAGFTHVVTRLKLVPEAARDPGLTEAERTRGAEFAQALSVRALAQAWQILLKGVPEVQAAPRPVAAAEMVLVRLAYAADLPTPDEALRALKEGAVPAPAMAPGSAVRPSGGSGPVLATSQARAMPVEAAAPRAEPAPGVRLRRFEDVVALAAEERDIALKAALEKDVRLVRFEEGRIELALADGASRTLANDLTRKLAAWTGARWVVALSSEPGAPTLHEQRQAAARERKESAAAHPLVQAVLQRFPGAQVVDVREKGAAEAAEPPPAPEPEAETDED
jgi:DNA polymerase-3 subunit gamma/tau